jgi:hypothetical protein
MSGNTAGKTGSPCPITANLCGAKQPSTGTIQPLLVDPSGFLEVTISGGTVVVSNPSVGPNGSAGLADSTEVGGVNSSGNLEPLQLDANNNLKTVSQTPAALPITQAAIVVGTTAVRCTVSGSAPNPLRVLLMVNPDSGDSATFYIGSSTVTNSGTTRGIQLQAGATFTVVNDAGDYWIVSSVAAQTVYIMEQA